MGKLTPEISETCNPTTSEASCSAISSPASAGGPMPSDSPAGPTTDLFGRVVAPASPSRQQVGVTAKRTRVISGLSGSRSSKSVALQNSLANKLLERLDTRGSMLFCLTWKTKHTPLRRPICVRQASVLPTIAHASGGVLPTLTALEGKDIHSAMGLADMDRGGRVARRICATSQSTRSLTGRVGLNPLFGSWMMGYPVQWCDAARRALETLSSRKSRRRSSRPISISRDDP